MTWIGCMRRFVLASLLAAFPATAMPAVAGPVPAESTEDADAVFRRAQVLAQQGKHSDAQPLLLRVLELRLANLGEQHADVAEIQDEIGVNLRAQGRHAEALPWHRKALAMRILVFGESHGWAAYSHDQLANTHYALGQFADAEPHVRAALDIRRSALGEKHKAVIEGYLRLGIALDRQSKPTEAEPHFRKALDLSLAAFGERYLLTADAYAGLATCLFHLGRADESERLAQKAFAIRSELANENSVDRAQSHHSLADNLQIQGRYAEAEPHYRKVLEIRLAIGGEQSPEMARAYTDLGVNLAQQGRFAEAQPLIGKGGALIRELVGDRDERTAYGLAGLAYLLELQDRHAEAEPLRREVIGIRAALIGEDHPDLAENYSHLASVLRLEGRPAQAEIEAGRAVRLLRIARQAQSKRLAPSRARRSVGVRGNSDTMFRNYLSLAFGLDRLEAGLNADDRARLFSSAFLVAQDLINSPAGDALVGAAARTAAGSDRLAMLAREEQDTAERLGAIDARLLAALSGADVDEAGRLREAYVREADALSRLSQRIDGEFPEYRQLISPEPITVDEAKRFLAADEALIVLVATDRAIYSVAIGPGGQAWSKAAGNVDEVYRLIGRLRCDVDHESCSRQRQEELDAIPLTASEEKGHRRYDLVAAAGLYADLIAGVEPALEGARRLYVTTSGSLGDLPLGMLITAPPPEGADQADPETLRLAPWLSDRYAVTTLPAVSALRLKRAFSEARGAEAPESFLGYGDPTLGAAGAATPRGGSFYRDSGEGEILADPMRLGTLASLPGTKTELEAMAGLFAGSSRTLRLGSEATESAFKSDPRLANAAVIAIATHGLLPSASAGQDEPGLVFTPPKVASHVDDGVLSASEAAALRLDADWVILSACNTASTAMGAGGSDSLSALSRAFLYAGARALLASHWRISDEVTAVLTVETLAAHRADHDLSPAQALQRAMQTVRSGRRPDGSAVNGWSPNWSHPAMWAPFSLIANNGD